MERAHRREYGSALLNLANDEAESELFAGVPRSLRIWNSHGDHVVELPPGFRTTARTENAVAATEHPERKIYTVEFHPEVQHTDKGTEILRNFLFRVCKAEPKWSGAAFIEETTAAIGKKVGTSPGDLRTERRRGLDGGGGAGTPRDRRPADEHFREHRHAAEERVRRHAGDVARSTGLARDRGGCFGSLPEQAEGRD